MGDEVIARFSYTIADWMINYSALHAYWNHRILNPQYIEPPPTKDQDFGRAAHYGILEDRDDKLAILNYGDFRTNASQMARDAARAEGKVPLLAKDKERLDQVVTAARFQLAHHDDVKNAFTGGDAELKLKYTDTDVACVARLDYLSANKKKIFDLKCTAGSAHPEAVTRRIFQMAYDIQGVMYTRAVRAVYGVEAEFYLITIETEPPFGLSVVGLDPGTKWLGTKKVEEAMRLWKESITTGIWPGYPLQTCWATLPVWAEKQWLERETME